VFECPALQHLRDRNKNLFQAPHGDAMILFMWQDDIISCECCYITIALLDSLTHMHAIKECARVHISWPSRGGPVT
jgi:hypothetical protein